MSVYEQVWFLKCSMVIFMKYYASIWCSDLKVAIKNVLLCTGVIFNEVFCSSVHFSPQNSSNFGEPVSAVAFNRYS